MATKHDKSSGFPTVTVRFLLLCGVFVGFGFGFMLWQIGARVVNSAIAATIMGFPMGIIVGYLVPRLADIWAEWINRTIWGDRRDNPLSRRR